MFDFSLGYLSLAGAVFFPLVYLLGRGVRHVGAWFERENGPKDRVLPKIILFFIIGLAVGSFAQPKWDDLSTCHELTNNWAKCALPEI